MPGRIKVLDSANKTMQRLGYLKLLCSIASNTDTSSNISLGQRVLDKVLFKIKLSPPFQQSIQEYAKSRLTDRAYKYLRKSIIENSAPVNIEIQDMYLADNKLVSGTGKLVETDYKKYPNLGTSLNLIKSGTYSSLTRSLILLALTPKEELAAFSKYNTEYNPFTISDAQSILFLYCFIENDADVLLPIFKNILEYGDKPFNEREISDTLPIILKRVVTEYSRLSLTIEERERIQSINNTAAKIESWKGKPYTGGGVREETIRVRIEPFCDLRFLNKPDRFKFEYTSSNSLKILVEYLSISENPEIFLYNNFFSTFAKSKGWITKDAEDNDSIEFLVKAGQLLKSTLGFSPITDVGLLASINLLIEKRVVLELNRVTELLKLLQKRDPDFVRFTVNRMGEMTYVKFLKPYPNL